MKRDFIQISFKRESWPWVPNIKEIVRWFGKQYHTGTDQRGFDGNAPKQVHMRRNKYQGIEFTRAALRQ
jgi:hypothetical protein